MGKVKENEAEAKLRKQINKAAGVYLAEQQEGDYCDAYKKLLEASENGNDNSCADNYVNVWEPLQYMTVAKLIELIENSIENIIKNNIENSIDTLEIPEFYKGIDWSLLKQQKKSLLKVIENCDDVPVLEHLEGILVLIDEIQDDAVNNFGYDEDLVFDLTEDQEEL